MAATTPRRVVGASLTALLLGATVVPASALAADAGADRSPTARAERTRMPAPLVVAHRGASGYRPEHTIAAYELAVAQGADYIEPDLVLTKDGVLVDRHEPEISGTTDVATRPEFAARKTTKNLDGTPTTGWFTEDFTLAELRTLRAKERLPKVRQQNTIYDGLWRVPTFEEVLATRERLQKQHSRPIGIIPEIKHSTYFHSQGLDPEKEFLRLVREYGLNRRHAPLWLQSFELTNLKTIRRMGYRANSTFLAWTGSGPLDGPFDMIAKGDKRTYAEYLTPAELSKIARFADGIGPEKFFVIPKKPDGRLGAPTSLVADAHRAGLKVIPWTFRNENQFMAKDFHNGTDPDDYGKAVEEIVVYLRTGIDGVFTDNPDTGVVAREAFRAGRDR
ncbi:glycerophosphodiester phosphodiesterase [Agilicoccus flavus]|uniref:glycerophosphodiester phosphodiesterase n=1 Tax=Agilicoccus flavus TaxID=2775968 RepID=UPI001CF6A733|nr:glycerophosphodiester phosphodiesterase [Agilicoccus flavus]